MPTAFTFKVGLGEFLPADDPRAPRPLAVLGSKVRDELYGERNPLGDMIRVGGERYRVIGVMESKGQVLGFDLDDAVYIPAARALELYNRQSLFEIDVLYDKSVSADEVVSGIERVITARHGGLDVTITTQQQMLDVLGSVLNVVTFAVGALGGISLLVGGVGIFTIMTIAVRERTAEIGLLRAVGADRGQVRAIFLSESMLLAGIGGARRARHRCCDCRTAQGQCAHAAGQHLDSLRRRGGGDRRPHRPGGRRAAGATRRGARSGRGTADGIGGGAAASPDIRSGSAHHLQLKSHTAPRRWPGKCGLVGSFGYV